MKTSVGLDEAGMGPWAGPLCVAGVVLSDDDNTPYDDSKRLSASAREAFAKQIQQHAVWWSIELIPAQDINLYGLAEPRKEALRRLVQRAQDAGLALDAVLVDGLGSEQLQGLSTTYVVRGEQVHRCIAAASILAKVARDAELQRLHEQFPEYGFDQHKGYGTAAHKAALQRYGMCEAHRAWYKPVQVHGGLKESVV